MKIKAIGFDFDGTLVMSESKKTKAMVEVFSEEFGINKGVKSAYQKLRGKNREEKVKSLFKKFLKRNPTKKELKKVANHFGKHYQQEMKVCPLFECTNVIKELKTQVKFLFLLTLEEKKEVKKIVKKCGLLKHFDEVLGGPKSKIDNFKHVIKKHQLKPSEVIYIGDSTSDIIASKKMKVKIVLVNQKFNYHKLKKSLQPNFVFSSICDLPKKIEDF
jgi:phosphoglycolate phosphatase